MQTNTQYPFFPRALYKQIIENSPKKIDGRNKMVMREILFNSFLLLTNNSAFQLALSENRPVSEVKSPFGMVFQTVLSRKNVKEFRSNLFGTRLNSKAEKPTLRTSISNSGKLSKLLCPANLYSFPNLTNDDFQDVIALDEMGITEECWETYQSRYNRIATKLSAELTQRRTNTSKAQECERQSQKILLPIIPTPEDMNSKSYTNQYERLVNRIANKSYTQDRTYTGYNALKKFQRMELFSDNGRKLATLDIQKAYTNILLSLFSGSIDIEYFEKCLSETFNLENDHRNNLKWNLSKYRFNPNYVKKSELMALFNSINPLIQKYGKDNWNTWLNFNADNKSVTIHTSIENDLVSKAGLAGSHFVRMVKSIKRNTTEVQRNSLMFFLCAHVESVMMDTIQFKAFQKGIPNLRVHDALECDQTNLEALKVIYEQELTSFGLLQGFNANQLLKKVMEENYGNLSIVPKQFQSSIPEALINQILFPRLSQSEKSLEIEIDLTPTEAEQIVFNSKEEYFATRWADF